LAGPCLWLDYLIDESLACLSDLVFPTIQPIRAPIKI